MNDLPPHLLLLRSAVSATSPSLINPSFSLPSLDQLDLCLEYRLALLIAPAGSGKTERLKQWVTTRLRPTGIVTAWLSLGGADNLAKTFTVNLASAISNGRLPWAEDHSSAGSFAPSSTEGLSIEDNLTDIINHLAGLRSACVLIFDNYQVILSPAVHSGVQCLIDYLPEQIHLVIASRSEPPLILGRYRVRRQMVMLGL